MRIALFTLGGVACAACAACATPSTMSSAPTSDAAAAEEVSRPAAAADAVTTSTDGPPDAKPSGITAGVATADITPQWPVLGGGAVVSEHYRNLEVKALAITEPSSTTVVFATLDLIEICRELSEPIYARVSQLESARQAGITHPEQQVILNAAHIHTTPVVCPLEDSYPMGGLDVHHQAFVIDQIVGAIDRAIKDRRPAALGTAEASSDININRDGRPSNIYGNAPNPGGPVDHRVRLLVVKDPASGRPRAALVVFGCHPTDVVPGKSFGGDYVGFGRDEVAKSYPDVAILTAQGTAGDVGPAHFRNDDPSQGFADTQVTDLAPARKLGQRFGQAIVQALGAPSVLVDGAIRTAMTTIDLPVQAQTRDFVDQAAMGKLPGWGAWPTVLRWGRHLLATYYEKGLPVPRTWGPYGIRMIRFGDDFTFAGLEGEIFTCIGRQIEKALAPAGSPKRMFVAGYTSDMRAYIPCAENFARGEDEYGFEINDYFFWLQPAMFDPAVDTTIVEAAKVVASRLDKR